MARETSAPGTTDSGPDRSPDEQEPTAHPSPTGTSAGRVPLDRLLSVVLLSPAQASLVAVHVLDAVRVIVAGNGTHPSGDHRWSVALTPSGEVDVSRARGAEGAGVTDLLAQLAENARRLPAHPRPEQRSLLHVLEEVAADPRPDPGARARELEGALVEVLGPGARERLSGQLAALVGAFAHIAPSSVGVPVDPFAGPAGALPDPHPAAPTRFAPSHPSWRSRRVAHRGARPRRTALVVVLVSLALAASGYVVLRSPDEGGEGARGGDNARTSPSPTAPADSSGEPAKRPRTGARQDVTALAGRQAGPITGVEVQKTASCTPGAPCPVTVTVRFRPASTTQPVTWKVGAARLCESGITWSAPITVTAQAGWTSVYASSSVAVPEGRSLALVALTTAPARAQSPPVPVTGSSLRC